MGYPELDPTKVTDGSARRASRERPRARALRILDRCSSSKILKTDPSNAEALLGLGQDQIALGFPNKSEQTLAEAAQIGSPQTKALANAKDRGTCAQCKRSASR